MRGFAIDLAVHAQDGDMKPRALLETICGLPTARAHSILYVPEFAATAVFLLSSLVSCCIFGTYAQNVVIVIRK